MNIRYRTKTLGLMFALSLISQTSIVSPAGAQPAAQAEVSVPAQDAGPGPEPASSSPESAPPDAQPGQVVESQPPAAASSVSANAAPAPAAPEADVGGLESLLGESVVTTASRSAERASTAPSTVYAITAEELRIFGIRSVDEALGYLGLGVYTSSARDYSTGIDVGAQGVLLRDAGKHILALVDGHTMNSQVYGGVSINEALGVPLETIDHIEVMLGAGSVVYGSNAMLLVVNVVTRRARDYQGVHATTELGIAAPHSGKNVIGGSDDRRLGLRYRLGASGAATFGEDADLLVAAEWLHDLSNSYGIGPYSGTGSGSFSLRPGESAWGGDAYHQMQAPSGVVIARYKDFRLQLQANHYERNIPLIGTFRDPDSLERQDAFRFDLRHAADLSPRLTLGSRLYGDYHRFAEGTSWAAPGGCVSLVEECWFQRSAHASWLGLEEQFAVDWFLDGTVSSTLGFDVRGRRTAMNFAEYAATTNNPLSPEYSAPRAESDGILGALFAQQVWKPVRWLTLNAGARLDADSDFGAHISPRAAVTVEPADGTSIRTSYSEAFRGPTTYELEDGDLTYRIPPASLKPEIVRVAELEVQQRLSLLTFSVRGFASFYKDFIQSRPTTAAERARAVDRGELVVIEGLDLSPIVNDNLATIESFGVSPSISLRLARGLQAGATFNYAYSRIGGDRLPVIPSAFGNVRISWQFVPDGMTLAAAAIIAGNRRIVDTELTTAESLGPQFDLKTTLSGPTWITGLRFRTSITYVHNAYLPYSSVTPASQPPGEPLVLFPVVSRLQGFFGLQYDYEP